MSSTKYHSQATITLEDNDKLTISCHYRSPSYNEDENNKFIEDMDYILAQDHSHHLMMRDLNMPHTDWTRMVSRETFQQSCLNKLNDHFMYQHLTTATRFRINQNTNIPDIVLTNEEHKIPTRSQRPQSSIFQLPVLYQAKAQITHYSYIP